MVMKKHSKRDLLPFIFAIFVICCTKFVSSDAVNEQVENKAVPEQGSNEEFSQNSELPAGHNRRLGEHLDSKPLEGIITELDYMISGQDFYKHFIRKRRPVVFRGGAKHWPAIKSWWNEEYLKEHYNDILFDVDLRKVFDNELNVRQTMNMGEFLSRYKTESLYLDSPFPQSKMMNDLRLPYCMQCNELQETVQSAHLLFSNGSTSSSFHHDGYENLLLMVSGTKDILLANHTYSEHFYARNYTTFPGVSPINPEMVDLLKFPLAKDAVFHKLTLHAGDILYNPQYWWHQVRSNGSPNIGVSIWFLAYGNFSDMITKDESISSNDPTVMNEKFQEVVDKHPTSIQCKKQTKSISDLSSFKFMDMDNVQSENITLLTMNTGQKIPIVGFGTAGLWSKTADAIVIALDEGYRLIDSAQGYNESGVGEALKRTNVSRDDIFIVSKIHPKNLGYDATYKSIDQSLLDLGVDFVDLMLIHSKECDDAFLRCNPDGPEGTWQDSWRALEKANDEGRLKSIGVSNFEVEDLDELMTFATRLPAAVQNAFDPFTHDRAVREWCKVNNVVYMSASTLGASFEREGMSPNPVLSDVMLRKIAIDHDIDVPRVVLRWAINKNVIVLPRSSNPSHIGTNIRLTTVKLTPDDEAYIDSMEDGIDFETMTLIHKPKVRETPYLNLSTSHVTHKIVEDDAATLYVSSDDHFIYAFDATTGEIMWEVKTQDETGSSCSFNLNKTMIYCGADDKLLRAIDRKTGQIKWVFLAKQSITSSPCIDVDGKIFVGSHDQIFYSIYPNGTLAWKRSLTGSIWSSPIINNNIVYIAARVYDQVNFFAFHRIDGSMKWSYQLSDGLVSSPRLSRDGNVVYVCDLSGTFYAFNGINGEVMWESHLRGGCESSPAVTDDGKIYIATVLGHLICMDAKDGSTLWTKRISRDTNSSPCLGDNNMVYIGAGNGTVSAFDRTTGDLIWSASIGTGIFFSTPRLATNGWLYIGTVDGPLYALDAKTGKVQWKVATNGPVVGTPLLTTKHAKWFT